MGKKIQKIMGTLLLVLAIAVTQIPVSDAWATTAQASDFQLEGTTLVKYTGTATTVSVPDAIKSIGREAFSNDEDLYTVTLPEGLQTIEYGAFSNCGVLKQINIPKTVTQIGTIAFSGCNSLTEIGIDKENTNFVLEEGVLYNKDKTKILQAFPGIELVEYNMPSTVKEIAPYAFWECDKLQTVTFSSKVSEIPEGAFANCKNLKNATIPESVNKIHETAFEGCFQLQIEAPEGSVALEYAQNRDTSEVAQREYEEVAQAEYQDDEYMQELIQKVLEENNLPGPGDGTINTLSNDSEAEQTQTTGDLLGQTSVVGNHAVVFIDNTKEHVISGKKTVAEDTSISQNDSVSQNDSGTMADTLNSVNNQKSTQFPKYTLVEDAIVANQAFYKDQELLEYKIPATVTQIGDFAFSRSGLKEITIPEGVTEIGYGAFYHCDNLELITIPSTVTTIEPSAFEKTKWLNSWRTRSNTNDFNIVGDGILIAYKGKDGFIEVPEGIKQIGPEVFKDHMGIAKVSLPSSLLVIGEEAFAGCNNLKEVTGGSNLMEIRDRAFQGCPIETVRVPETVQKIGLLAFDETQTTRNNETTSVVFMGTTLPEISYEDSTTRLANSDYRDLGLKGISVAVVDASIDTFEDTILSKDNFGFRGLVCSIVQENDGKNAGILEIKQCTVIPDAQGSIELPKSVNIYGKKYEFTNIESTKTLMQPNQQDGTAEENAIQIRANSEVLKDTDVISAILPGNTKEYVVSIKDSESAKETLEKAYQIIYGENSSVQINAFDIGMYDLNGTIPIKKMGKESVTITVPFPNNLTGNPQVVCTDDNGQLERVESAVVQVNGKNCIEFKATHFSPYGIYTYNGNSAVVDNGNAVFINSMRQRDASPDTGDGIHPKWFLAMGLLALSILSFCWKRPLKILMK